MAKRGRPRKNPEPEGSVGVLETSRIYEPDYQARLWWFVGVKVDKERNHLPFHNMAFGGVPFQQGTQRQVVSEDAWLSLDAHRTRVVRQHLYSQDIERIIQSIKHRVVRWSRSVRSIKEGKQVIRWSAKVLSLENRIRVKIREGLIEKFVPGGYRFHPTENDVPLSKYLVLITRGFLKDPGAGKLTELDINNLPSMFDLDPSLVPDRMGNSTDNPLADEPW